MTHPRQSLARAATPEQEFRIGNQTGGRVFRDLYGNLWDLLQPAAA